MAVLGPDGGDIRPFLLSYAIEVQTSSTSRFVQGMLLAGYVVPGAPEHLVLPDVDDQSE